MHFVISALSLPPLSQRCAHFRCHNAVPIFAVTTLCPFLLSQRCAHFRCHNAVPIFAVTTLCSFSLSQRCAHRCLTTVGFLLCDMSQSEQKILNIYTVNTRSGFVALSGLKNIQIQPSTLLRILSVFKMSTLESGFKKLRVRMPDSSDTCGRKAIP